jgi:hypothetical protein
MMALPIKSIQEFFCPQLISTKCLVSVFSSFSLDTPSCKSTLIKTAMVSSNVLTQWPDFPSLKKISVNPFPDSLLSVRYTGPQSDLSFIVQPLRTSGRFVIYVVLWVVISVSKPSVDNFDVLRLFLDEYKIAV